MKEERTFEPLALHIVFVLSYRPLGRRKLTSRTFASESKVRTCLEKLRNKKLVRMEKEGTKLTERGRSFFAPLFESVGGPSKIDLSNVGLSETGMSAGLKGLEDLDYEPWKCRDLAVKEGASGSLILKIDEDLTFADTGEEVGAKNPKLRSKITDRFGGWRDFDFLVMVSGPDYESADRGLWRIISGLVPA